MLRAIYLLIGINTLLRVWGERRLKEVSEVFIQVRYRGKVEYNFLYSESSLLHAMYTYGV